MAEWIKDPVYPSNLQSMTVANSLLGDTLALRDLLDRDGYLYFRNVIPVDRLRELRAQIVEILEELGWIEGGSRREEAIAISQPYREGEAGYFSALDRIAKLETFHRLAHEPQLINVMRKVLGESAFPHPLGVVRLVFPNNPEITTPPHQDYRNNQGTPNLTASWIPLGHCPAEAGGLAILEGSHKAGLLPLKYHLGPGNRAAMICEDLLKLRWVTTDYCLGDIVLFPSLTVHSALDNLHPARMRLSVDFRYQLEGEALTERCLEPHFNRLTWKEIYSGWQSKQYQYYWKDKKFIVVPWDESLHALPESHLPEAVRTEGRYNRSRRERMSDLNR